MEDLLSADVGRIFANLERDVDYLRNEDESERQRMADWIERDLAKLRQVLTIEAAQRGSRAQYRETWGTAKGPWKPPR